LTLSNDTGPMHLSYAVGTPVVAIFSTWQFSGWWFPPNDGLNQIVRAKNVPCAICMKEPCSHDSFCMEKITIEEVIEKIELILTKKQAIIY
ncbi:MAG: glycosyltransferase family 9 protein, partial [Bacteroidetes bacterium]|nr:glycosyltransferase family 9 protein [Bacteroidota bacterium]